ncbi:hypothetical protein DK412_08880 [Methylobacterium sp. 17Sr1-1]|nr:hypothetical protein DK412_08880 [Methylobacterium sp. 17Sr1-1]
MGRRAAPVTQADITRAIRAVQDAGLPVVRVIVRPNGEVIVETVDIPQPVVDPIDQYAAWRDVVP